MQHSNSNRLLPAPRLSPEVSWALSSQCYRHRSWVHFCVVHTCKCLSRSESGKDNGWCGQSQCGWDRHCLLPTGTDRLSLPLCVSLCPALMVLQVRVSLCGPGHPGTQRSPSSSWVLRLKGCTTTPHMMKYLFPLCILTVSYQPSICSHTFYTCQSCGYIVALNYINFQEQKSAFFRV